MKKFFKWILPCIFFISSLNLCYAKDLNKKYYHDSISKVNNLYNSVSRYNDQFKSQSKSYNSVKNKSEVRKILKDALHNRVTNITIEYLGENVWRGKKLKIDFVEDILNDILDKDHYLKYSWKGYDAQGSGEFRIDQFGEHKKAIITINLSYLTTKGEEDYVDREVNSILSEIITKGMNDYEKEKAIHDYIVLHLQYDTSLREHSAYAGLHKGRTVCQGYSLLMQKMLQKVGIKSIIVESKVMNHAWNMVCIDNRWYHVDVTWDDPVPDVKNRVLYNYYNLTDDEMANNHKGENHTWDKSIYPKAKSHYDSSLLNKKIDKDVDDTKIQVKVTNNIRFDIKLNQNVKMKKIEVFKGDKFLGKTYNIKNNIGYMKYLGDLDSTLYKLKITVDDGRVCYTDVKIEPTLEILKVDNKNKVVEIKSLIDGKLFINNKIVDSIKKGKIIKVCKEEIISIVPNNQREGTLYYSANCI